MHSTYQAVHAVAARPTVVNKQLRYFTNEFTTGSTPARTQQDAPPSLRMCQIASPDTISKPYQLSNRKGGLSHGSESRLQLQI
jgi:hypothetical protein